jgi:SulP family sulfate permease
VVSITGASKAYGWPGLRKDLVAGLTVAAIAVPQAMAYALIAGVEPRFGLYSAIVVTALASVFGSSSLLINGPTNAISIVVFSALAPIPPEDRMEALFVLGIVVGLLQIAIALFKLGDLTRYISESVVLGFMAGAGVLIALSQVGNLLGLPDKGTGNQHLLYRLYLTLTQDQTVNPRAVGLGLGTVVLVVLLRRVTRHYHLPRFDMLLALVLAAVVAAMCGWSAAEEGKPLVAVIGAVKAQLPTPHVPVIDPERLHEMAGSATAIALLGLLEALTIAKSLALRTRESLDYNRQCLAEGLANLVGGVFRCLPGSGSLTRSSINYQAGAVSRWSGVFSAAAVAVVVVALAPQARFIPKASMAGILLVTAAGLVDWARLRYALRASRYDAMLVLTTAFVAVFVSVEYSILAGVAMSILFYVPRAARLMATELAIGAGRVVRDRVTTDPPCPRMVLFDLEGELFFGAAPELDRYFDILTRRAEAGAGVIVLRVKRTRNPDVVCLERLEGFLREMQKRKVTVLLCGVREDFDQAMRNLHFQDWFPKECVFREADGEDPSTLRAVRRAYELLGDNLCATCPRRTQPKTDRDDPLYYVI